MMTAEAIAAALNGGPSGNSWSCKCPAHDDKSPSLSIKETAEGNILIHCFALCSVGDIVAAVNLELSDLFPEKLESRKGSRPRWNYRDILEVAKDEAYVAAVGLDRLLRGDELVDEDIDRMRQAMHRLIGITGAYL